MDERQQLSKVARITRIANVLDICVIASVPVATILALETGGVRRAVLVGIGAPCVITLLWLPVHWLTAIGNWRSSGVLWRKRMASGFYKTLPPVEEDDD